MHKVKHALYRYFPGKGGGGGCLICGKIQYMCVCVCVCVCERERGGGGILGRISEPLNFV